MSEFFEKCRARADYNELIEYVWAWTGSGQALRDWASSVKTISGSLGVEWPT